MRADPYIYTTFKRKKIDVMYVGRLCDAPTKREREMDKPCRVEYQDVNVFSGG